MNRRTVRARFRRHRTFATESLESRLPLAFDAAFTVAPGHLADIGGVAYQDVNGNSVLDQHDSDGQLGYVLYGDAPDADWNLQSLASSMNGAATEQVYRGAHSIHAVPSPGNYGVKFSRVGGAALPVTGLTHFRLWAFAEASAGGAGPQLQIAFLDAGGNYHQAFNLPVSVGTWQEVNVDLSTLYPTPTSEIKEILVLMPSEVPFYIDEVALLGDVPQPAPAAIAGPADLGLNLFYHEDYAGDAAFADVLRTLRRWGKYDQPWLEDNSLTFTDQGVPLQPAGAITFMHGYDPGLYQLRFRGTGTVDVRMTPGWQGDIYIVPGTMHTEGDETVALVQIDATGVAMDFRIQSNDSQDPIRDLHLLAPGYHGATAPLYRNEFLDRVRAFGALRLMNYSQTNDSDAISWSQRRLPDEIIQTGFTGPGPEGGVAWELLIEMANDAGIDPWINVPHLADNNYITELATLWHSQLNPDRDLIVEFSNEVWNPGFAQYAETGFGNYQTVADKLVTIRSIFDAVWGADKDRVKLVLAGQAANLTTLQTAVTRIEQQTSLPASDTIDALAIALYSNVNFGQVYTNLYDVMNGLLDMSDERGYLENLRDLAVTNSLAMYAYEAGQHLLTTSTSYPELVALAQDDPRMALVYQELVRLWQAYDGDLLMQYTFTGDSPNTSQWGLLLDQSERGSVKWDATLALLLDQGDANLDSFVDYDDFVIVRDHYGQSGVWWEQGDFDADRAVGEADLIAFWLNMDTLRV
ncbi:MAG: hypothetical protein KDB23_26250, partial [Planctomycetales bacterium]|nr:hypothetical protein [Planctomycetales bacterium]